MNALVVLKWLTRCMLMPALSIRAHVLVGFLGESAAIFSAVAGPYLLKHAIDLLSAREPDRLAMVLTLTAFACLSSSGGLSAAIRHRATSGIIEALGGYLSIRVMQSQMPHLAREPVMDSAELNGRLERLPISLQLLVDGLLWQAAPLIVQTTMSLVIILLIVPPYYAAIIAVTLSAYLVTTWHGVGRSRQDTEHVSAATLATSNIMADVLRNARRVMVNGNLTEELIEVEKQFSQRRASHERGTKSLAAMSTIQCGIVAAGSTILLVQAALDVNGGWLSIGDFVLVQAYLFRLMLPVGSFAFLVRQSGRAIGQMQELLALFVDNEVHPQPSVKRERGPAGLVIKDVSFRYQGTDRGLSDIDAIIEPGSFVAITGPNGSGKSTLARILAGLLPCGQGLVAIDGRPIDEIASDQLPEHVLYVPQHIGLFNRSLGANALYPPTRLSADALCALLSEWKFFDDGRRPDLAQLVGEQGERLSGGQVQKLELARLTGVDVPLVILDESTSSLDPASEIRLIDALRQERTGRSTLILITHRRGLTEIADQVLFLRDGHLVGVGPHAALLQQPDYRDFWTDDLLLYR